MIYSGISGAVNRDYDLCAPTINAMTADFLALLVATCCVLVDPASGARRSLTAAPTTAPKIIDISSTPSSPTPPSAPAVAPSAPRTKGACTYTVTRPGTTLHR